MQMLNDGDRNDGGKTDDDDDDAETAETGPSHNPMSTRAWLTTLKDAQIWICASKNIDWVSRRIFPTTFVVFNIIYWSVYLSPPHYHCDLLTHDIHVSCYSTHDPVSS